MRSKIPISGKINKVGFQDLHQGVLMRKAIIITGASRGIGAATARILAKDHNLVLVARRKNDLQQIADEVIKKHGNVLIMPCDVTVEEQVRETVKLTEEKFGRIDILINNAGIGSYKRVDEFTLDEFKHIIDVNIIGTFLFTKYVILGMIERKKGQVINVASVAGLSGFKNGSAYSASKFAVVGFSESLREDVKQHGIAVSIVCPGAVNTSFGGKKIQETVTREFLLEPEDVARTLKYLVDESETANTKLVELKPRKREKFRE